VIISLLLAGSILLAAPQEAAALRVPINADGEIDFGELLKKLGESARIRVPLPQGTVRVPIKGISGALMRTELAETLGAEVVIKVTPKELQIALPAATMEGEQLRRLQSRVRDLAKQAVVDAERRVRYGLHALPSYRANDRDRPTICLIHGINSTSGSFMHMVEPLESAGFGLVAYDFPFNRALDKSVAAFQRDWREFRRAAGEIRPWAIVTHSMGGLIARAYVEDDAVYAGDVTDLLLIAPPNEGSAVAKGQVLLQMIQGLQLLNKRSAGALSFLSDGLGEAADDLLPRSAFLNDLNVRPRRSSLRYHILAGDLGFLNAAARNRLDAELKLMMRAGGLLGGLTRLAAADLPTQLDELTDGRGDGCVAVASTKLKGVSDHEVIHANHVELIRGPLLYPDPGPVACMPWLLKRLEAIKRPTAAKR
jgi:pimeloyl-ACP methyl ester carboxylesterase